MRIFVAGATGAVGRPLVPLLIANGHSVIGLTHTPAHANAVRALGAEAAVADGLDATAIHAAVHAARPDVIVHEMTALKGMSDLRTFDKTFATSNRLRTEGTDHLLAAARDARVKRFVAQSYCGWPYARAGGTVKSEADPLDPDPPAEFRRSLDAIRYLERTVAGSASPEGIVLRYGTLYGPGTGMLDGAMISQLRARRVPLLGDGGGFWSFVHVEDAARATALAIERGRAGEIYNIVDDEPAPVSAWLPALSGMVGAKQPFWIPAWIGRLLAGEHVAIMMTQSRAGSNAKAKRELAWQPEYASWRRGFSEALKEAPPALAA